ncbi:hypothetical protein MMC11_008348 [Xylographa trunciseda]|nr:hypothetical protein [Xylographa trunciseda]
MTSETSLNPIIIHRGSPRVSLEVLSSPSFAHLSGYQRAPSLKAKATKHLDNQQDPGDEAVHNAHVETQSSAAGLASASLSFTSRRSISRPPSERDSFDNSSNAVWSLPIASAARAEDYGYNDSHQDIYEPSRSPSFISSIHQPYESVPDTDRLNPKIPVSVTSSGEQQSVNSFTCKSRRDIKRGRWHWLSITILVLAIYSTVFSAIWLVVAALKPRYGGFINTTTGRLSPINASTLTAAFAKTIELSFVTVFVAFIGQVLSRRAIATRSKGITIAEMSTRHWVTQPGMMFTNWESVKTAGNTTLGILSMIAVIVAVLYTTASDTLDSPKLKLGRFEDRLLYGRVATSFANASYTEGSCQTPITIAVDDEHRSESCIEIQYSGQAFHNLNQYLGAWANVAESNNKSTDLQNRPPPIAMLYDNTTVQGSWISTNQTMREVSERYGRIVNNVTMAMPHSGVFGASQLPQNGILQPQDFSGLGQFFMGASVPSPAVNVLCVGMSSAEVAPLVYEKWPGALPLNPSTWPLDYDLPTAPDWLNSTAVDDIFEFGERYNRRPPIFPKYPTKYNTILNTTIEYVDALYVLAASSSDQYMLCSLSVSMTPNCSTWYNASISGGAIWSQCEDPNDSLAYSKSQPNATNGFREKDWVAAAFYWGVTVDLNGGISDSDDSTARLLTQLMPTTYSLDPALPSIAEALAVMAGPTLLTGSMDSPFVHFFNYTAEDDVFDHPVFQQFPATLAYQDYASGGNQGWQGVFLIVLVFAFLLNLLCLAYFIWFGDLVNDFTEPQNLFALAVNSPQSHQLAGSCGGGPEGEELRATWYIDVKNDHCFIKDGNPEHEPLLESPYIRSEFTYKDTPISNSYSKLSRHRSSIL